MLDRKLRRDLFHAKGLLSAIICIIAFGTACFVAMRTSYFNLSRSQVSYYAQLRMADFWVNVKKAPLAAARELADIPGITAMRTRIAFPVTVDVEGVERPLSGQVLSLPDERQPVINDIMIRGGSYFTARQPEEVIVNEAFAKAHRLRPGDRIHLLLNNRRQALTVVGSAISPEFVYQIGPGGMLPEPENYGIFYIKQSFAESVFDFEGACNEIVGLLSPRDRERPDAVLDLVKRRLEPYGVLLPIPRRLQQSHFFVNSELEGLRTTSRVLPTIFLLVAALLLNVLMMRLADQQRTVLGTLKAIGYSDMQLTVHLLKFGMAVGLAGGLLGVLGGYTLAGGMTQMYRQFYSFPDLSNRFYIQVLLSGISVSVVFALLGTIQGVRMTLRLAPAEAMRPKPPVKARRTWLERWPWFKRRLGFRGHMVARNILRGRMRTAAGVFASSMGAAIMMVSLFSNSAVNYLIDFQFEKMFRADYELIFKDAVDSSVLAEARRLPGVDYMEPTFSISCTLSHGRNERRAGVTGLTPGARLTVPRDAQGQPLKIPATGLALTRKLAELLQVTVGDTITLVPTQGERKSIEAPVSRIADSYLGLSAYANYDYLNRLMSEEGAVSSLQLKVDPAWRTELYRELKRLPALQTVNAIRDQKRIMIETLATNMTVMTFVTLVFASVIYGGSILNASLISLSERAREIGTFRVLGYTPWEIGAMFLAESLVVNSAGTLLGLPLGYLLCMGIVSINDTELFRFPLVLEPQTWIVTVALGLVFTLAAHALVQRSISKMDWAEALKINE